MRVRSVSGGPVRVLIAPDERDLEIPNWSPDGTHLATSVTPVTEKYLETTHFLMS